MELIRVCIADDHKLFRRLTIAYLQSAPRIDSNIMEADNGRELLRKIRNNPVDVVILDISMPIMGGEEAAAILLNRYPNIKIVMLTINDSPGKILELMNQGVHGYLLKDCEPEELVIAIESVTDRDFYRNTIVEKALKYTERNVKSGRKRLLDDLTNREKEILRHICEEFTTKEIGLRLSISQKTVENHRMNMLQKLSARNTVGLVKYAYENGLLPNN
ncbi:MAG TPA: response regulator transcription factor [Cyclobacteriaceae bacterium]|nr:response regulator transcription factor [Cyclobacteriaceae bacterium]